MVFATELPMWCEVCVMAVDAAGDAYVAGTDAKVIKLNPSGSAAPVVSTLLSPVFEGLWQVLGVGGIAVDRSGNMWVTGRAQSRSNLPVTPGALQPTYPGGQFGQTWLAELDNSGTRVLYATYFGAPIDSNGPHCACTGNVPSGIAVTAAGDVWISGWMFDPAVFPSKDGFQEKCGCFNGAGPQSTYIAKIRPAGHGKNDLLFATVLGGDGPNYETITDGLAVDSTGAVYVTALSESAGSLGVPFPTTVGAFQRTNAGGRDIFVTKISGQVCDTNVTGNVTGNVVVGAGSVACLYHANVSGSVTVNTGGDLSIDNSTVNGSVTATRARTLTVCASTIGSGLTATRTTGFAWLGSGDANGAPGCLGDHITGDVVLKNSIGSLELGGGRIIGNVTIIGTSGIPFAEAANPELERNVISGNLACSANLPAPTNDVQKNKVFGAATGQCAGL